MALQKDEAVVLSSAKSGESDRILHCYTRKHGRRDFILKGIRKSRRRSLTSSDPGTLLSIIYYSGKSAMPVISDFSIITSAEASRGDLDIFYSLSFILELIKKSSAPMDNDERLYLMLTRSLEVLNTKVAPLHFAVFFLIHLLKQQGLLEEPGQCRNCGKTVEGKARFHTSTLHIYCAACAPNSGVSLSTEALHFWRLALTSRYSDMSPEKPEALRELLYLLTHYIEEIYSIEIRSSHFLLAKKA